MSITVYNPSSKPAPEVLKTATRKTTLKGGILGIIDNRKPTASLPITDDEIQKLTKKCSFVLAGVGD